MKRLLIANRGEVAVRVARTARDMNIETVAIYAADDAQSKHVTMADNAVALPQTGVRAYLNGKAIIQAAVDTQCDALHPGWGFVSENADFAAACESAGINFVGPDSGDIAAFADKVSARNLAIQAGIPVLQSSGPIAGSDEVRQQWEQIGFGQAVMLKAVAGGGGRGMALLHPGDDSAGAFERCAREAETGFGNANLYLEQFLPKARHIEVQVVGDGTGACIHLGTRDCSLQRRRQKLIEIAPAPWLPESTRDEMTRAATALLESTHYRGVGTVEFLCNEDGTSFFFIEVNPRLQVEHTVTEMMLNTDIVSIQLAIAAGATLNDLELSSSPTMPTGFAVQVRVNAERMGADGIPRAATGTIEQLDWAGGPDIRIDSAATVGTHCSGEYDSLLAKVVVRSRQLTVTDALRKTVRVLSECDVRGVHTSLSLAERVLALPEVNAGRAHTQLLDDRLADIADAEEQTPSAINRDESAIAAPVRGRVVSIDVVTGDRVRAGARLLTLESMKMHHDVVAPSAGTVQYIHASIDTVVDEHATLLTFEGDDSADDASVAYVEADLDSPRADLDDLIARTRLGLDAERPAAVAKRHKLGFRTARENVDDLLDNDSFIEYGGLAIAAQRRRRSVDELMQATPADGMIAGVGTVNAEQYGADNTRCAVLAYDYTVLAGTQGHVNHKKKDRLFEIAKTWELPVVFFTEGGGGRPGDVDTDDLIMSWLDLKTFTTWAELSGVAPRIAVNSGRCFAGNAVVFGCADITIATQSSNIGLAGPAMIEGGGLGSFTPEDIGPIDVQTTNGVVDIACANEAEATQLARQVLGFFQGRSSDWTSVDQRHLRHHVPENRLKVYDIRKVIADLADTGSVVELRPRYGVGMVTALVRIEGHAFGLIANNPKHLGGAIDSEGGEKGARFLQLCDTYGLPVMSLCDTPGYMVGPDSEKTAAVRRGSRLIIAAANLSVPLFTVVLRKGYGLGGQAMAGGGFHRPFFTIAWPTAEFGPMGLEGAVVLGYKKELESQPDEISKKQLYDQLLDNMYTKGKGVSVAQVFEIDAVIDPRDTREWLLRGLRSCPIPTERKRNTVDVW